MNNPFTDIDWSKPNEQLAVDLQVVTSGDYVGYTAWSKRLGPPDTNSPWFVWSHAMTKDEAVADLIWALHDRFAPEQVAA